MPDSIENVGIEVEVLQRYVEEQIYALPGTDRHREEFSVLLTGSRAFGAHTDESDVDIEVLCRKAVFDSVHAASLEAGIIKSPVGFFCPLAAEKRSRYFGERMGNPHFSITPLETVERQIEQYEDVSLWIWTHVRVIEDPNGQFQRVVARFRGYPKGTLVRKIKYRWLAGGYWTINGYPHHHGKSTDFLAGSAALLNSINEHLRVFFLVEGSPYPYAQKLMRYGEQTKLGREFCPLFRDMVESVVGHQEPVADVWERLDSVFKRLCCYDLSEDARRLQDACDAAMIAAGVDPDWVNADYQNIDELLQGELGPFMI